MRVLFYLPLVTDWFFDDVVKHLIRLATRDAEVHVVIPMPWLGTGVSQHQLDTCAALTDVKWHILDGADHTSLRTRPAAPEALVEFVHTIAPDYTFCRTADVTTPLLFPGRVRFLMEAAIPPFKPARGAPQGRVMLSGPGLFDRGELPLLNQAQRAKLTRLAEPVWSSLQEKSQASIASRESYLRAAQLPFNRRIIAAPLDCEGKANFLAEVHASTPHNAQLVLDLAEHIGEDCILALTQHPLNVSSPRETDRPFYPLEPALERVWERARIVRTRGVGAQNATSDLIRHCDGMIVGESKSMGYGLFFEKPILRLSRNKSADWMHTYDQLQPFLDAVRDGRAKSASPDDAQTWFGFHYGNDVFSVQDPDFTFPELIDRTDRLVGEDRWEAGIARWTGI